MNLKNEPPFHANGKLMRLNRLPQGVLPASSELNEALRQIMSHIPQAHVIHDDILIATATLEEQYAAIGNVFQALSGNVLTLKGSKCLFALKDIPFWGMRITSDGIKPCPEKCRASQEISHPTRKEDIPSFLAMLQSHSTFVPHFSKLTANIRNLQKKDTKFIWTETHQREFDTIKKYFKESTTLSFFDPNQPTWSFVVAAQEGLGATIAQGPDINNIYVVAFASRTTTAIERRYPQIDLEAMAVDFGLRHFREYCVGAEKTCHRSSSSQSHICKPKVRIHQNRPY